MVFGGPDAAVLLTLAATGGGSGTLVPSFAKAQMTAGIVR